MGYMPGKMAPAGLGQECPRKVKAGNGNVRLD